MQLILIYWVQPLKGLIFFLVSRMELVIVLALIFFINGNKPVQTKEEKTVIPLWQQYSSILPHGGRKEFHSKINKSVTLLNPSARHFFNELTKKINDYNSISGKLPFFPFEGLRHPDRQAILIKEGNSWIRDPFTAPHVQGRAIDYVQKNKKGLWVWNQKEARNLRKWIDKNFELASQLRGQIIIDGNPVDSYHYELKRAFIGA